jgi:hypothetical protein
MKMKINNFNISQLIILCIICCQPIMNFKLRLMGYNSYDAKSNQQDYQNRSDRDSQDIGEISNLEIRNQIYNHNLEPIRRTYDNDNSSSSSSSSSNSNSSSNSSTNSNDASNTQKYSNNSADNSPKFISKMYGNSPQLPPPQFAPHPAPHFAINSCPCAAFQKCQPCGLIPDLDFTQKFNQCPCAPKLNCPACPPLSLIHEIAAKKVNYIFK